MERPKESSEDRGGPLQILIILKAHFGKCIKLTITKEMIYNLHEGSGFSHLLSVDVNVCTC